MSHGCAEIPRRRRRVCDASIMTTRFKSCEFLARMRIALLPPLAQCRGVPRRRVRAAFFLAHRSGLSFFQCRARVIVGLTRLGHRRRFFFRGEDPRRIVRLGILGGRRIGSVGARRRTWRRIRCRRGRGCWHGRRSGRGRRDVGRYIGRRGGWTFVTCGDERGRDERKSERCELHDGPFRRCRSTRRAHRAKAPRGCRIP